MWLLDGCEKGEYQSEQTCYEESAKQPHHWIIYILVESLAIISINVIPLNASTRSDAGHI
jgi:hypothetical protein